MTQKLKIFYFTARIIKIAYDLNIDNNHDKHAKSILTIISKFGNVGIDTNHIYKKMEEMSRVFANLINQYQFKYKVTFLVSFNKYGEYNEITSEIELFFTLSITHNLTQGQIHSINIQCTLENRIQGREMKEAGWNFQRNNTMRISF